MKSLKLIFILIAVLSMGACQPRDEDMTGGDPLEAAYQKIDRGDYDAAISSLENQLLRDPRPRVREALASAYAARAGVRVENYWGAVVGFKAPLFRKNSKSKGAAGQMSRLLSQLEGRRDLTGSDEFSKLAEVLVNLGEWQERIGSLPVVPLERQNDLQEALLILQDHKEPGGRLYRALLGLILLKSELVEGFSTWGRVEGHLDSVLKGNLPGKNKKDLLCVVDYGAYVDWGRVVMGRLQDIAADLAVAYPSKKEELENAVLESRRVTEDFLDAGGKECP